jgi:DNA polymerase-3 subunit alpha
VIREVRVILTKKGNSEMAFVKAEDTTGTIDMVVFPRTYQEVKNLLLDGKAVIVEGRVDTREEEISFLVEKMGEIKVDNSHVIHIPENTSKESLQKLKELFEANQGTDLVTLFFEKDKRKIIPKQKVSWSEEFFVQISDILTR